MTISRAFVCSVAFCCLSVGLAPAQETATLDGRQYVRDQGAWFLEQDGTRFPVDPEVVSVRFLADVEARQQPIVVASLGSTVIRHNRLGIFDLEVPQGEDVLDFVRDLQQTGMFEFAEANTFGVYLDTPNDPSFSSQWALHNTGQTGGSTDADIDAPAAWDITKGAPQVTVAVLDSGTDIDHSDLNCNIWVNPGEDLDSDGVVWDTDDFNSVDDDSNGLVDDVAGWDFFNGNNNPRGPFFHGTHVAGIVAACSNNGSGMAGVAGGWGATPGIKMMTIGVGDSAPSGSILDDSILYAAAEGARVITLSLTVGTSSAINAALDSAAADGVFIDNASGNASSNVGYPATHPAVVAVGATDHNDNLASFSNFGPTLELVAPGVNILSTAIGGGLGTSSGTSFASPHVAGLAGLMFSVAPGATHDEVRNCLQLTAEDEVGNPGQDVPGRDDFFGHGRINAPEALNCVSGAAPGDVPNLLVGRTPAFPNRVTLSWDPSCSETAVDYAIYSGIMGLWSNHGPVRCADSGGDLTENVGGLLIGNRYFLVVPMDASREGSYGTLSNGTERAAGTGPAICRSTQSVQPCR